MKERILSTELVRDFKHMTDHERRNALYRRSGFAQPLFSICSVSLRKLKTQVKVYQNNK